MARQPNHGKRRGDLNWLRRMNNTIPSALRLKPLAIVSGIIAVLVFAVLLVVLEGTSGGAILGALLRFTVVLTALSIFWWWFEKYGWRQCPSLGMVIRTWPDLNGRWEGTIDRVGPDPPHPFVLEIFQTLTSIRCTTYSENGESHSCAAGISNSSDNEQSYLFYLWIGETSGRVRKKESGFFYGTTVLALIDGSSNDTRLEGSYWTDRKPPNARDLDAGSRRTEATKGIWANTSVIR